MIFNPGKSNKLARAFFLLFKILSNLDEKVKLVLAFGLSFGLATFPFSIAFLVMNRGTLTYKDQNTEIVLDGKKQLAVSEENTEKLESQLHEQNKLIQELVTDAKKKKVDNKLPKIKELEQSAQESEVRLDDFTQSQEKLNNFVELTIAEPE